jgi:DNA-binding transcriptional LysR family regulator
MSDELDGIEVFVAVAEAKGFRAAGERLGVSGSAISQALRRLEEYEHIQLDLFVSDEPVDIVAAGYDAGIRLGEVIDRDMIAVPVSGDLRLVVVGSPSYFAKHRKPKHPRDLVEHDCINWHPTAEAPPYRWEFTENMREFSVDVRALVLTNDPALNIRLARAGAGLSLADDRMRDYVSRGELVPVLEEFSTPFLGFYLYYPERRHASPALRALVDYLRRKRQEIRAKRRPRKSSRLPRTETG